MLYNCFKCEPAFLMASREELGIMRYWHERSALKSVDIYEGFLLLLTIWLSNHSKADMMLLTIKYVKYLR